MTYDAASDDKVGIMTILDFQWPSYDQGWGQIHFFPKYSNTNTHDFQPNRNVHFYFYIIQYVFDPRPAYDAISVCVDENISSDLERNLCVRACICA